MNHFGSVRKPQVNNKNFCKEFGRHVRTLREQRGLSMRELASNLDLEYNQIYRIEKGLINTSISMAQLLADGLGVSHQEIFNFKFPLKTKK